MCDPSGNWNPYVRDNVDPSDEEAYRHGDLPFQRESTMTDSVSDIDGIINGARFDELRTAVQHIIYAWRSGNVQDCTEAKRSWLAKLAALQKDVADALEASRKPAGEDRTQMMRDGYDDSGPPFLAPSENS